MAINQLNPHKDKTTRLLEHESDIKSGVVRFVDDGEGVSDLISQLLMFPNGTEDDLVDAMVFSISKPSKFFVVI